MPFGAWAHSMYWRFDQAGGGEPPGGGPSGIWGYASWQAIHLSSLFGGLHLVWERLVWTWRVSRVIARFAHDERRDVLMRLLSLLAHPAYPTARASVKKVATTLGFNKPTAWGNLAHILKSRPDWAENHWRHLYAMQLIEAGSPQLNKPDLNLLAELAYHGYALRPRR